MAAVLCCAVAAWRLWRDVPRVTVVGQVDAEVAEARTPASGTLFDPQDGTVPHLYDAVNEGQVIARVEHEPGRWQEIKSPLAGQITEVHRQAGQEIHSGQVIFTIAANRGHHVTAYLRGDQWTASQPGAAVKVQPRSDPRRSYQAVVERVGPQFQKVPDAQVRDRKSEEWGLPVIIRLLPDAAAVGTLQQDIGLRPGELVIVSFRDGKTAPTTKPTTQQTVLARSSP